jgi:hypothetical protein
MVDINTKLVVSEASASGETPGDVSVQQLLAGSTTVPGAFSGTFDGAVGSKTPAAGVFTTLAASSMIRASVVTALVAGTTHSLAGATPLTAQINVVATVANASDAVALPSATAAMVGAVIVVFNNGGHAAAIWPQAADAIDGGTAGVAVALTNALRCAYYCVAANTWISAQLGAVSA